MFMEYSSPKCPNRPPTMSRYTESGDPPQHHPPLSPMHRLIEGGPEQQRGRHGRALGAAFPDYLCLVGLWLGLGLYCGVDSPI
jgi:hypothetical protein